MSGTDIRLKVVAVADYFPPATRGGAARALAAYVDQAKHDLDFRVLTRDHDALTGTPLDGVISDAWQPYGTAQVRYMSSAAMSGVSLVRLIEEQKPDIVYLNSLFSTLTQKVLWSRRLGHLKVPALVLAPEGELSPNVLRLKAAKKWTYLALCKLTSLYRDVIWKAASDMEREDIIAVISEARVAIVPNISPAARPPRMLECDIKRPGWVRLLFLSRITPAKNLDFLLRQLAHIKGKIDLTIIGPIEHNAYWRRCCRLIAALPRHVQADYGGACTPEEVWRHYSGCHAFILPTLGENFGFVIADALSAGCPVLTSDRTPWPDLDPSGAGHAIPLREPLWRKAIQDLVDMDATTLATMSEAARGLANARNGVAPRLIALMRMLGDEVAATHHAKQPFTRGRVRSR